MIVQGSVRACESGSQNRGNHLKRHAFTCVCLCVCVCVCVHVCVRARVCITPCALRWRTGTGQVRRAPQAAALRTYRCRDAHACFFFVPRMVRQYTGYY